jgi:septal ring factor EnvC (AmiA/AmiB activator)
MRENSPTLQQELRALERSKDSLQRVSEQIDREVRAQRQEKAELQRDIFRLRDNMKRHTEQIEGLLVRKAELEQNLHLLNEELRANQ